MTKTFRISELPFLGDFALGTSQMSYSDPNLKGLVLLTLPVGAEIMAEVAGLVVPNRTLLRIDDLSSRRTVSFEKGAVTLFVRAERIASGSPKESAVKVQIRDDSPDSAYTWPVMEATVVLADALPRSACTSAPSVCRRIRWTSRPSRCRSATTRRTVPTPGR